MHLYFLRHGEAGPSAGHADADRPLTEHGLAQAWTVGTMLRTAGVEPDLVWCSPLLRAKQTAESACMALGIKGFEVKEFLDPSSDQRRLFAELNKSGVDTVLIIGHQPFIGESAALLIGGTRDVHLEVDKGTCICVEVDEEVRPGAGHLVALLPHRFLVASHP